MSDGQGNTISFTPAEWLKIIVGAIVHTVAIVLWLEYRFDDHDQRLMQLENQVVAMQTLDDEFASLTRDITRLQINIEPLLKVKPADVLKEVQEVKEMLKEMEDRLP